MKKIPIYFPFLLALFATLFGTIFFPNIRLVTFAPFLAVSYNRLSFPKTLWLSFGCGLIIDCLSAEQHFGLYALNFVTVSALLYPQRRHFFEDKATALAFFTAVIATLSTTLQLILIHLFDEGMALSWKSYLSDIVGMSILDSIYAFLWFICPMRLYTYIEKTGWKNLFKKLKADEE